MKRALAVLMLCAAMTGIATACGDDGPELNGEEKKTPRQVLDDAKASLAATPAVHFAGPIGTAERPVDVDLQLQGQDAAGTQVIQGLRVELVVIGDDSYVRAPEAFWGTKSPSVISRRLADRWVRTPGALRDGLGIFSPEGLAELLETDQLQPEVTRGEVDGQPAVIVSQQNGSQLFVANTGAPVPLRIVAPGPPVATLNFTNYGQVQPITAPPGAIGLPGLPSIPSSLPDLPTFPTGIPTIPDDLPTIPDFPRG